MFDPIARQTIVLSLVGCLATGAHPAAAQAASQPVLTVVAPEAVGFRSLDLASVLRSVREDDMDVHSIVVVRGGKLVLNADFYPNQPGVVHDVASVTKSVTSMLVGIAVDRDLISSVHAPVVSFFSTRTIANLDDRKRRVTIEDLLTMRSGWCRDFVHGEGQLDEMRQTDDWVQFMLDQPMVSEPGGVWAYCTGASHVLSAIITSAAGMPAAEFARRYLFGPLGITDFIWPADPQGISAGGFDLHLHPIDAAKLGLLMLREGRWGGRQVLSEQWVRQSSAVHVRLDDGDGYGYRWWMPDELPGLYEGRGRGGQRLAVWPEQDLVVVLIGSGFDPGEIGRRLLAAMGPLETFAPDPAGVAELEDAIAEAAAAPLPQPVTLPPMARTVSGVPFVFDPNPLGIDTIVLTFNEGSEARLVLTELDGDRNDEPVGLDGVYRISHQSRFGLPEALRGAWMSADEFHLCYNEFADNHIWDIQLRFAGDRMTARIRERSGLLDTVIPAHRAAAGGRSR